MITDNKFSLNTIATYTYKNRIPQVATIELLTLCNLQCEHCYIPEHNNNGLDFDFLKNLLEQLKELGTLNLVLTGGEIFLRKDIMQLIEFSRKLGFSVSILSNATIISKEQIAQLADLYINVFSTTIFSLNSKINDSITGVEGSLQMILDNIKEMKSKGIKVEIKTPLMKKNMYEYRKLQEFCSSIDFNYVPSLLITSKYNGDNSTNNLRIDGSDLYQINKEIGGLLNIEYEMLKSIKDTKEICPSIRNNVYIDSSGDVFPCNSFLFKIGSIKYQSLKDIWFNSEELKYLTSLTKDNLTECKNCDISEFCTRCPGHALLEDGSIFVCSSFDKKMAQLYSQQFI